MKRVLLVSAVFPPQLGGTSEKMARRAKYFLRNGWQTVVLAPKIPPGIKVDETNEHVPGELALPGVLGDDPHRKPVLGVLPCIAVLDEEFLPLQVGLHPGQQTAELL